MTEKCFDVKGMSCAACSARVSSAVQSLGGVQKAEVSLLTDSMTVVYDENKVSAGVIEAAVREAGYEAAERKARKTSADIKAAADEKKDTLGKRLVASLVLLIPLMYVSMGPMAGLPLPGAVSQPLGRAVCEAVLAFSVMTVNFRYYTGGIGALVRLGPNMDSLIALGSGASFFYSLYVTFLIASADPGTAGSLAGNLYFEGAGMIVALVDVGKYLEARSRSRTTDALRNLMDMAPETATVIKDGAEVTVRASDVKPGDTVSVRPGGRIPVDGTVLEGVSSVSEAALTGESMPAEKEAGSRVYASSINNTGYLKIKAEKVGTDTSFGKIVSLVEKASSSKAPIARTADRVSAVFVPCVMAIAVGTFAVWKLSGADTAFALTSAISVLVVSCPCALGLATPVAIMVGTGKGAESGILFKSAAALEEMGKIDVVVFDKTGTLTEGKPKVSKTEPFGCSEDELVSAAASLESRSEHPVAAAVLEYAREQGTEIREPGEFESLPGVGIKGTVSGRRYSVGNARILGKETEDAGAAAGETVLYVLCEGKPIGRLYVADRVKPGSANAVKSLRDKGVDVYMITGDIASSAEKAAKEAGIGKVLSEVLPEEKERNIRDIKSSGKRVAMVGDGVNDAPALSAADVGIAIGSGTDVALECADIVLEGNSPSGVSDALALSRAVMRKIRQNLFWAFFYNALCIPLAAGALYGATGFQMSPMLASAAMSLSSVTVVTNALGLMKFRFEKDTETEDKEKTVMKETINVCGMMCMHCVEHVRTALLGVEGTYEAVVDLGKGTAEVTFTAPATREKLEEAVCAAGYSVTK